MNALTDTHQRTISYLRLSVTDRCNLRCRYCMPEGGVATMDHDEILTYEEMLRLTGLCLKLNMTKVRLTGGEPLVRKGIVGFIRRLKALPAPDVRITTNGTLLADMAEDLFQAGVSRVNVSLDTLDAAKFKAITRCGRLERVLGGLEAALAAGFDPVKINVVVIRGQNDDELEDFARLAIERPFHVRFIEFMPMERNNWRAGQVISSDEVLQRLSKVASLSPIEAQVDDGPARRFKPEGGRGEIGLISPVTNHFCPSCNRLRMTSDGKLLTCLFSKDMIDLRTPLRSGASDDELTALIRGAAQAKPDGHHLAEDPAQTNGRPMRSVGG